MELRKTCDGFRVSVKHENWRIGYPTEGIEGGRVARLREAEVGESCLHSRGGVAQHIKMLYRASIVAHLYVNTIARKNPCVLPRKVVVRGSCYPGSDCEVTRW